MMNEVAALVPPVRYAPKVLPHEVDVCMLDRFTVVDLFGVSTVVGTALEPTFIDSTSGSALYQFPFDASPFPSADGYV